MTQPHCEATVRRVAANRWFVTYSVFFADTPIPASLSHCDFARSRRGAERKALRVVRREDAELRADERYREDQYVIRSV